jgi:hypothetical protein
MQVLVWVTLIIGVVGSTTTRVPSDRRCRYLPTWQNGIPTEREIVSHLARLMSLGAYPNTDGWRRCE